MGAILIIQSYQLVKQLSWYVFGFAFLDLIVQVVKEQFDLSGADYLMPLVWAALFNLCFKTLLNKENQELDIFNFGYIVHLLAIVGPIFIVSMYAGFDTEIFNQFPNTDEGRQSAVALLTLKLVLYAGGTALLLFPLLGISIPAYIDERPLPYSSIIRFTIPRLIIVILKVFFGPGLLYLIPMFAHTFLASSGLIGDQIFVFETYEFSLMAFVVTYVQVALTWIALVVLACILMQEYRVFRSREQAKHAFEDGKSISP